MFLRSFFIITVCNYERMQNLGFLYIIAPVLKKIYPEKRSLINAYKRHLEFFNINPYFVTIPIGIVTAMEEEKSSAKSISDMKMTLSGPLAAVGDSLFWAGWRPFSTFMIVSLMFLSGYVRISAGGGVFEIAPFSDKIVCLMVIFLFLFIYNVPGLFLRFYGLKHGYEKKTGVIGLIKKITDIHLVRNIRFTGHLLVGLTAIVIFFRDMETSGKLVFLIGFPLMAFLLRRGIPVLLFFYSLILFSVLINYL